MGKYTDEHLRIFIDESIEHLSDIENELLAIEQRGADIDENLVNKVYRAAHSIKGGAGFMGLANIKNLTHEMENVLGGIRARDIIPDAAVINVLLAASDNLRNLINDIKNSDEADIAGHMASLSAITEGPSDPASSAGKECKPVTAEIKISLFGEECVFSASTEDISTIWKEGKYLYLIEPGLSRLSEIKEAPYAGIMDDMRRCGVIIGTRPALAAEEDSDGGQPLDSQPFLVLFATVLKPSDIEKLLSGETVNIYIVHKDYTARQLSEASSEETAGDKKNVAPEKTADSSDASSSLETLRDVQEADENAPRGKMTDSQGDKMQENDIFPEEENPPTEKPMHADADGRKDKTALPSSKEPPFDSVQQTSLRVNIKLLDMLMTLAGELVLSRNQLLQSILCKDRRSLEVSGQRIDLITSELQEAIMHTRMQPIRIIFDKFPRIVRDLAISLNKKIDLILEGKAVELDKSIIENLNDPMTHLIRNAADHGIESPEYRAGQGKKPAGTICLKAYHEAGQVNIEISDDGRGMDGQRIAASAITKGLVSKEFVKEMSAAEKVNLIFLPGFSTSDQITDFSGRGVGMDVVKTNLDRLGGLVEINAVPGEGTSIHIKLPLTLAIIPSLLVSDGNEQYAIPQVNVVELLRIPPSQIKERMEYVGDAQVIRLRDTLLPLLKLSDILRKTPPDGEPKPQDHHRKNSTAGLNIAVVSTGIFKYGMIVDKLHDSEEIVVKPLGRHLKNCKAFAGATILGDGHVALILDVANLARLAKLSPVSGSVQTLEAAAFPKQDLQSLLLFRNSENTRFAVPLELVERIEKIQCEDIEIVGGRRVMQYRNVSMPLFDIGDVANVETFEEKKSALVIVFFVAGMDIGILAIPPIDTTQTAYQPDDPSLLQPGISGSRVIDGKTTLMVDVIGIIETLHPEWFTVERKVQKQPGEAQTIILAEDSKFFRNQIKCTVEDAGYRVIEAEDGMTAWDLLQENADQISLVVTDLEMPNLDGFGFTRLIKADKKYSHLPVIAVSSLAGKEDIKKAKESGVDEYQIKLDRKKLLDCIKHYIGKDEPILQSSAKKQKGR
jgi:two-component system chemotaxis sensor kinase CheA